MISPPPLALDTLGARDPTISNGGDPPIGSGENSPINSGGAAPLCSRGNYYPPCVNIDGGNSRGNPPVDSEGDPPTHKNQGICITNIAKCTLYYS